MVVDAKLGLLGRGHVVHDHVRHSAFRDRDAWWVLDRKDSTHTGRVSYDADQYQIHIERGVESVAIDFPGNPAQFDWRGRVYEIRLQDFGRILVAEGGRTVVRGRSTGSGVRLERHAPELEPIIRELALGLALHLDARSREGRLPRNLDPSTVGSEFQAALR